MIGTGGGSSTIYLDSWLSLLCIADAEQSILFLL